MRKIYTFLMTTLIIVECSAQSTNYAIEQELELQKDVSFINQNKLNDDREVVGVATFKCDMESPYIGLVTEKIVEFLKNCNRFIVVDRTNMDRVYAEMEFQKREEFIGRNDLVEQGNNLAAQKIIQGTITKIPVYRMKNADGTVRGYKASVSFVLKVDNVETGETTQSTSFEGKTSKECMSAQAAVQTAMNSLQDDISEYFRVTFPLHAKIMKILSEKNGVVESIMIRGGFKYGIKIGDKFMINSVESFDGEEILSDLGIATVTKLLGDSFSECKLNKRTGRVVFEKLNAGKKIRCTLSIKK